MGYSISDECCGCATENYPCLGSSCRNKRVVKWHCDFCGETEEPQDLFFVDVVDPKGNSVTHELCKDCMVEHMIETVPRVDEMIDKGKYDSDFED